MKNISAIVLCRSGSKRLKQKHFKKIGNSNLIEIILDGLLNIRKINEIYIATGPKKKNYIYEKNLKKKYQNKIKFFYHNNENNVNERIYELTKKIKNNFLLIYSGDCPIVEEKFIKLVHKNFLNNKAIDYIKIDNCIIEGIDLYRKNLWKKIYQNSKASKELMEYPGYIIKTKPFLFKEKKLSGKKIVVYQSKKKIRLSIDTQSDLDFFKALFILNKDKKKIDYKTAYNYKKLSILNSHVAQKKNVEILSDKIILIGLYSKKYGHGHISRLKTIEREINETITSDIKKLIFEFKGNLNINFFINKIKLKNYKNKIFIIDVPNFLIKKLKFLLSNNKVLVIDNVVKHKNAINIIPSLRKPDINKSKYIYGKNALIIKREVNFANLIYKKTKNYIFIFPGATGTVPKNIINFCIKHPNLNFKIFSRKKNLNIKNIKFFSKKNDFLKISKEAKAVITRLGVYVYECLALNKKVFVWDHKENGERLKDIKYLEKNKYVKIFNSDTFCNDLRLRNFKYANINAGAKKISEIIKQIL